MGSDKAGLSQDIAFLLSSPTNNNMIKAAIAAIFCVAAVRGDWSGTGNLKCYGHVSVTAGFPAGAANEGEGSVRCTPVEWVSETGLGPEAMFFENTGGHDFEIWAWDYHPSWGFGDVMPEATCEGSLWYKEDDMDAGFCTPNYEKGFTGCGTVSCVGDIYCTGC